jgi:glucosamine--fructose-6-phosphate aminotransferase (isomerizing)
LIEKTYLYQEIHQQPEVLAGLLEQENENVISLAKAIQDRQVTHVVIAARGTSDNAARYAKYLLGAINGLPVALATPSLFSIYQQPPRFKDALVLGISQSGKSPDIVAVLQEAKRQQALTATITNFPGSALGQAAEHVIDLHAGQEQSIAATKTYTSELTAIAKLSVSLKGDLRLSSELARIPEQVSKTLSLDTEIRRTVPRYRYMKSCVVIGRGFNYATAYELALKLKELTYTSVEPFSSADFLHGPLAMIEHGFPVIVIAPSGVMDIEIKNLIDILNQRKAEVIAISDVPEILSQARIPLTLPVIVPEWLSPIVSIVPGQMFAMHLAHEMDYDVDHPRDLRKVTETL